jgi:hypothetical protein
VSNQKPFSLLVDSTTDSKNVPYLICFIQTIEDGYPMTYFYRLVELKEGESAEHTFNSFWSKVLEDNKINASFVTLF